MKKRFANQHERSKNKSGERSRPLFPLMISAESRQRGVALITVLLIVVILLAVVIELNRSSRADIYDAANLSDGIKLSYITKSGFYGAATLIAHSDQDYDTLRDDWARMEQISVQSGSLFPEGYFIVTAEDECGKIPLNKLVSEGGYNPAIRDMLVRLLNQPEFALEERQIAGIVDSIKDWIDEDEITTDAGAESSYYSSLDPPYRAKNAPFDCIEELLMIKGVTKEIYYGTKEKPSLAAYVTADSDGLININTAPAMVLRALADGITPETADELARYRAQEGVNLSGYLWYKETPGMSGITIPPELLTVKSNYFKINSTGKMNEMTKTTGGIVRRTDQKSVKIIKWRLD